MWAYSLAWLFFSLASLSRGKFPFNLGWWSFTFPLGVWTSTAILCGQEMPSRFFTILGMVLAVIVILLWLMVSVLSIRGVISGRIFVAPDFEIWKAKHRAAVAPAAKEEA
ncbi:hypothetical protein NQ176_g10219 [Zarea fungicola]|uniref:Uncharacterized protein n=1 Tax=Zarea fungicola TaxID=93591 RepID=A0ACC1MIX1_9HYPO|nr:hypothetical protein NQ176_g10219 [Lecanicillium fungicola]